MNNYLALLLGIVCAGFGGEFFVRGIVGLALWVRVPVGLVGVTLAAFATSSPELSVSLNAALAGSPEISLGDALGSNVMNVALILGITLLLSKIIVSYDMLRRDFPVALGVPVLIGLLTLDGVLSRVDAVIMLVVFGVWLAWVIGAAWARRNAADGADSARFDGRLLAFGLLGLFLLIGAGRLIVMGAKGIAASFSIDEFIIGATIVAIATGTPELATTILATIRGHADLGVGNLYGSNIFNGLLIVAVAALIAPITVPWQTLSIGLGFGLLSTLLTYPGPTQILGWRRGCLLLATYVAYLVSVVIDT